MRKVLANSTASYLKEENRQALSQFNGKDPIFKDVFNGLLPALIGGIPSAAVFFGIKDYVQSVLKENSEFWEFLIALPFVNINDDFRLTKMERTVLAVTIANIPYWILRSPSEVLKTRAQLAMSINATMASPSSQVNSLEMISFLWKENGKCIQRLAKIYIQFKFIYFRNSSSIAISL